MKDEFQLQRFVEAQTHDYDDVVAELRAGRKRSHWMWFIFPQIEGLGHSAMAQRYAISGLDEAKAYLQHKVLGARLRQCLALVNAVDGKTASEIFGSPDDLKFRSSVTLFSLAAPDEPVFQATLDKYFGGRPDSLTVQRVT